MDVSRFRQLRLLPRRLSLLLLGALGLTLGILAASARGAAADRPSHPLRPSHEVNKDNNKIDKNKNESDKNKNDNGKTCSGTFKSPGVLAGTHTSNVTVEGACLVNAGPAVVEGNLTVSRGAVLLAAFVEHGSALKVEGNLRVERDAILILGCGPQSAYPCLDNAAGSSQISVAGNLSARQPLGVVVHNSTIDGNVRETGGGGGFTCANKGPTVGGFPVFGAAFGGLPVFSGYDDSTIHGSVSVVDLTSCWLGMGRDHVDGSVRIIDNQLADPDAIEIVSNQISDDLVCRRNSMVWDSAEHTPGGALFPRDAHPNTVLGDRRGQCELASPATKGGPSGPGPF